MIAAHWIPPYFLAAAALSLVACKPQLPAEIDPAGTEDTGGDEIGDPDTGSDPGPGPGPGETETGGFVPDMPLEGFCDPWAQDCQEGEKCVPFSTDGGPWNANHCVAVQGDGQVGDSCTWDGIALGSDSCGADSHCWDVQDVDGELVGTCTAFCQGSADDPSCEPQSACLIANEGSITLCVATCDPLAQDCGDGLGCFWGGDSFQCIFTAGDILGGEPCGYINDCAPGHLCAASDVVPGCAGSACCTPYCDLTDPSCADPQTECVAFFEEGMTPPGYEGVGVCVLPGA